VISNKIELDSYREFSKSHENVGEGWIVDENKHVAVVNWDNAVENVCKLLHSKIGFKWCICIYCVCVCDKEFPK